MYWLGASSFPLGPGSPSLERHERVPQEYNEAVIIAFRCISRPIPDASSNGARAAWTCAVAAFSHFHRVLHASPPSSDGRSCLGIYRRSIISEMHALLKFDHARSVVTAPCPPGLDVTPRTDCPVCILVRSRCASNGP